MLGKCDEFAVIMLGKRDTAHVERILKDFNLQALKRVLIIKGKYVIIITMEDTCVVHSEFAKKTDGGVCTW